MGNMRYVQFVIYFIFVVLLDGDVSVLFSL